MNYWQIVLGIVALAGCNALLPQAKNPEDCVANPGYCATLSSGLVCDTILHSCQRPDAQCLSEADCPAPTNVICNNKMCASCIEDKHCAQWSASRELDTALTFCINGTCRACQDSSNCLESNQPICDPLSFQCRGCASEADCRTKDIKTPFCNLATRICYACNVNADCNGTTPYCNQGNCVQCLTKTNCAGFLATPYCADGSCVQCIGSENCTTARPICDEEHFCRACLMDAECQTRNDELPICDALDSNGTGQCITG
jgi:hypothetical protein